MNVCVPDQGLDGLRIQAEIETADRKQTKRPTWAPAMMLDGELLELCRELEYLSNDDKPVARLWAEFNDPKGRGRIIRSTFSKHPLTDMRCRGFEMHAAEMVASHPDRAARMRRSSRRSPNMQPPRKPPKEA
jgi:hypothetical protein